MPDFEPDYKRPFSVQDFRGYFTWSASLSQNLNGHLYHACHEDELLDVLKSECLNLRSNWAIDLPVHGTCEVRGTWTGLNFYTNGNKYGPFLIQFPVSVLNGKQFMVFRRVGDRHRHFFVQYEAMIPIYSFEENKWRKVNAEHYFDEDDILGLSLKPRAIYDIILTQPLSLKRAVIRTVDHPDCIARKCDGASASISAERLSEISKTEFRKALRSSDWYREFIKQFPDLVGAEVTLPASPRRQSTQ